HESEEISSAPDALNELLVEADLSDFHGADHHDDECPVCRAIKKVEVLLSGVAPASHESEQRQEALSIVLSEIQAWEEDERVNYPDDEVLESLDRIRDALACPEAMRGMRESVRREVIEECIRAVADAIGIIPEAAGGPIFDALRARPSPAAPASEGKRLF